MNKGTSPNTVHVDSYSAPDAPPKLGFILADVGIFRMWYIEIMELVNTENVAYMDEYPHITERLRLRRLAAQRPLGHAAILRFDPALRDRAQLVSLIEASVPYFQMYRENTLT